MDLRIQKTRAAIKNAFLELRRKKPIEKITVTELSKIAEINKATFYLHYSDIYSLAEEIEEEMIDGILSEIQGFDNFPEDPKKHTDELFRAFLNNRRTLNVIFSGSRHSNFANKIEERIKARLYSKFPQFSSRQNDIVLSYIIQGTFYTVAEMPEKDVGSGAELTIISRLNECLLSELTAAEEHLPGENH